MASSSLKSHRGFASMDQARQREIASQGGRAAHAAGTAHEFTPEEAAQAGRKGGEVVSRDRAHMAAIGRQGGLARGRSQQQRTSRGTETRDTESNQNSNSNPSPNLPKNSESEFEQRNVSGNSI